MPTEVGMIPSDTVARFGGPSVAYALLGYFNFQSGAQRFWSGVGKLRAGGHDWLGVSDPGGTRMVTISEVALPEPNVATAIRVGLTGVNQDFITNVYENAETVEGRDAELFLQVFDGDYGTLGDPISVDPTSTMTSAKYRAVGPTVREVSVTLEGTFSAKNFPPGAQLTDADQQRRNPGDRVCEFAGLVIEEIWGPNG